MHIYFCCYFLSKLTCYVCRSGGSDEPQPSISKRTRHKNRRGDGRGKSSRPDCKYTVTRVHFKSGAPFKPDIARKKFSRLCGQVARERVNINLSDWRQLSNNARAGIKKEILKYFIIRDSSDLERVERAALLIACKAWKQWKSRLVTEFVDQDKSPLELYPMIKKEDWVEFKSAKSTKEFKDMSKSKRELAKTYKNHHKMGTAGYAGMSIKWDKEDEEAELCGLPKQFEEIKDPRARDWMRARVTCDAKTDFKPKLRNKEDIAAYERLVRGFRC